MAEDSLERIAALHAYLAENRHLQTLYRVVGRLVPGELVRLEREARESLDQALMRHVEGCHD